jgi:hypothetical protein
LWLVVAGGVEGQFADEFAVVGDDSDLEFVNDHEDVGAGPGASDSDVVQPAAVAKGEFAVAVDAVFSDSELFVDADSSPGWDGWWPGGPGGGGGAAADGAMGPPVVVVVAVAVELGLQIGDRGGGGLALEPVFDRLVDAFDFAAGLRVVGLEWLRVIPRAASSRSSATQPRPR